MPLYAAFGLPTASASGADLPPNGTGADVPRNGARFARFVLVREGFDWLAFFFAPFYALAHGLWSAALVTLAMLALAVGVPEILGLDPLSRALAVLGYAILCGVSAHDVRGVGLKLRGYRLITVIAGRDRSHALIRLAERLAAREAPAFGAITNGAGLGAATNASAADPPDRRARPRAFARLLVMSTVIIDYGSGNLRSAAKAFERAARESGNGREIRVTHEAADLAAASHIVLPGVGAFADCRAGLHALPGMWEAIDQAVTKQGKAFLGICVGMQLMARVGREHGEHPGFGWIDGEVIRLEPGDAALKVPHMGWNDLAMNGVRHPVLNGIASGEHAYFVHSYHLATERGDAVLARVDYGGSIAAVVGRDNMVGTQFHPEKSQALGLKLIANFLAWRP